MTDAYPARSRIGGIDRDGRAVAGLSNRLIEGYADMIQIEMNGAWDLPIGVAVITADGERLGRVTVANDCELLVEGTPLHHPIYALNLIDVARFEGGILHLKLTTAEAVEGRCIA